jgi:hypothetical protein
MLVRLIATGYAVPSHKSYSLTCVICVICGEFRSFSPQNHLKMPSPGTKALPPCGDIAANFFNTVANGRQMLCFGSDLSPLG